MKSPRGSKALEAQSSASPQSASPAKQKAPKPSRFRWSPRLLRRRQKNKGPATPPDVTHDQENIDDAVQNSTSPHLGAPAPAQTGVGEHLDDVPAPGPLASPQVDTPVPHATPQVQTPQVDVLMSRIAAAQSAREHWKACIALAEAGLEHAWYARIAEMEAIMELGMHESMVPDASEDSDGVEYCDPRGCFATLYAVVSFTNALVNFSDNAIAEALPKVERANSMLTGQPTLVFGQCARLFCRALFGVLKIFRHEYATGAWQLLNAWWTMRGLDVDSMLVSEGVERDELRGIALLVLGCLHIFGPMAKSFIPSWATGRLDRASLPMGIERLRTCYDEGGMFAPIALSIMYVQKFLLKRVLSFEPLSSEDVGEIESMVEAFEIRYPASFMGLLFRIPILNHYQRTSEATALIATYRATPEAKEIAPAIMLSLTTYNTRSQFLALEWHDAGARLKENIGVIQANGRRAVIPTLAYSAALFFYASAAAAHPLTHGGKPSEQRLRDLRAAEEMMQLLEAHQKVHPGKKWNASDKAAFKVGEILRASPHPDADAVVELMADYLGTVVGSNFRDENADALQRLVAWHLEEGSPCAQDSEWRMFALVCTADLTMQRSLAPNCSAARREQLLADTLRQCDACELLAPSVGGRRGLLAQTVFVRAKTLMMMGSFSEALEATQRATRLHKKEKPRLVGPFVALKLQLPLLKAKIQKEQEGLAA